MAQTAAVRALIFDFDGLILDTEVPDYQSWSELYQTYGCVLSLEKWIESIGSMDLFDPYADLEQQLGRPVDRVEIQAMRKARVRELVARQKILPGVEQYIGTAKRLQLKLGLASSSSQSWVMGYLSDLGLADKFDCIRCRADGIRSKPDPDLYLAALHELGIEPYQAIALEDSRNGVLAAKRAGIFCVAVPNTLMRHLTFEHADLRLGSLDELPLEDLLLRVAHARQTL